MPSLWAQTLDEHRRLVLDLLLDSFERLVAERGFEATTLAAVAADAGIARSAIYNHVPDKNGLLFASVERSVAAAAEDLQREVDAAEGPREALAAYVKRSLSAFREHPVASHDYSGVLTPEQHDELMRHVEPFRRVLEGIVAEGVRQGVFRGTVGELAAHITATLDGYRASAARGGMPDGERVAELLLNGLAS